MTLTSDTRRMTAEEIECVLDGVGEQDHDGAEEDYAEREEDEIRAGEQDHEGADEDTEEVRGRTGYPIGRDAFGSFGSHQVAP